MKRICRVLEMRLYIRRYGYPSRPRVGLVVIVDAGQIVEVIDHKSGRLSETVVGLVTEPVNAFDDSAVREVKMRHWIAGSVPIVTLLLG